MEYEAWKKRQDRLGELNPDRKRGNWRFDYIGASGVLVILIVGMTACVTKFHGSFDWLL